MSQLLLSKDEQGVVVFHIFKSLNYTSRLFLSISLIIAGFIVQFAMYNVFPGILFVLAGNLLLVVKGYDNRIKLNTFKHDAEWVPTNEEQLINITTLFKKMKKWDVSALDITSGLGFLFFFLSLVALVLLFVFNPFALSAGIIIVALNFVVLLYPHWFTGTKRIATNPRLENKIKILVNLMANYNDALKDDTIKYLMMVEGSQEKIPLDVKMQIKFKDQPEAFMGLYAQIALNNVQGADYPYFYVVLVAQKGSGILSPFFNKVQTPDNVIKELKQEGEVDIIVIRQETTKTSGYHTNEKAIARIFETGVRAARELVRGA
jgi:hypothetical protein